MVEDKHRECDNNDISTGSIDNTYFRNVVAEAVHDFNNALTIIKGVAQILEHERDFEIIEKRRNQLLRAANKAEAMSHRIMNLSKDKEGKVQLLSVHEAVTHVAEAMRPINNDALSIHYLLESSRDTVESNRAVLQSIFSNLISNSLRAMHGTDNHLTVTTETLRDTFGANGSKQDWIGIAITDSGCGMDEDTLARAVEPYFTTRGKEGGMGIGLPSVQNAVRKMGGTMELMSTLGVGTTVHIRIPLALTDL